MLNLFQHPTGHSAMQVAAMQYASFNLLIRLHGANLSTAAYRLLPVCGVPKQVRHDGWGVLTGCLAKTDKKRNVMLNLFQHPIGHSAMQVAAMQYASFNPITRVRAANLSTAAYRLLPVCGVPKQVRHDGWVVKVPFSLTHNDTISNGIALCPNLHRAFDRGLITIDGGYRVRVSAGVIENAGHPYSLKQFNGMAIHLPVDRRYYPDPVNLEWHGREMFKG